MLSMDTKAIRFLARMGARGVLGQAVYDWACDGNDFFTVSADLAHASGFSRIIQHFPEHFVDVGIAEQNMIGVAAGLANTNIPVVATTWAMFASARVADQVRNFMGYMQKNIKLVGMDSGFALARYSNSHSNPPDISIMRAIPGITILSPCDGLEIYKAVYESLRHPGPVYIRLTGQTLLPIVHKNPDFDFKIGKAIDLSDGQDVAILATGNIVKNAMDAAAILLEKDVSARVIDMHTIQPLDTDILDDLLGYKLIVTCEEHLIHGGFGSSVAEYFCQKEKRPRQIIMGVDNCYPASGSTMYTTQSTGLSAEQIADTIMNNL